MNCSAANAEQEIASKAAEARIARRFMSPPSVLVPTFVVVVRRSAKPGIAENDAQQLMPADMVALPQDGHVDTIEVDDEHFAALLHASVPFGEMCAGAASAA